MIVELVAHTTLNFPYSGNHGARATGYQPNAVAPASEMADELGEIAGRLCYQSWNRPNPETATNAGYLKHILESGHFSVLEHATATLYVAEVSRAFLTEIERHRHLSFSVVSQRYVDASGSRFIEPPALTTLREGLTAEKQEELDYVIKGSLDSALDAYQHINESLEQIGLTRKQAREAARAVLPNMTETKMLITGNLRAWREVIANRAAVDENGTPFADAEMFAFSRKALEIMKSVAPNTFQDMS